MSSGGSSSSPAANNKNCLFLQRWPLWNCSSQLKHRPLARLASCSALEMSLKGKGGRFGFGLMGRDGLGAGKASLAGGVGNKGGGGDGLEGGTVLGV